MTIYRITHPTTGNQATRTSDRVFTHGVISANGMGRFSGSLDLAHKATSEFRPESDARVVQVEILQRLPKKPKAVDPELEQRRITVTGLLGGTKTRRTFLTMRGAQDFAATLDLAGQVSVEGASLEQVLPEHDMPPASDPRWTDQAPPQDAMQDAFDAAVAAHPEGAKLLVEVLRGSAEADEAAALEELLAAPADSASTEVAVATPTSETYAALQQAYDHFNARLFQGRLPPCLITLQRKEHRVHGYFWADRFQTAEGVKVDEIAMNPQHFNKSIEHVLSVLVHEMTHAEQAHFGKGPRKGYHDKAWGQLMVRVGLHPSETSQPGGKTTGQKMGHYIMLGGRFEEACAELLADGAFRLRWTEVADAAGPAKKKKATRAKYVCPDCSLQMWGKPASKLICGECEVPMPEEEAEDDC